MVFQLCWLMKQESLHKEMIEAIGKTLRSLLGSSWKRVTPVARVQGEGVETGESRERERYSGDKRAQAQTHFLYGSDGKKHAIDPQEHEGNHLDTMG